MPATAPARFVRFQKRARRISGPNAAPNPAHANDTIFITTLKNSLCVSIAMNTATSATVPTARRETTSSSRFVACLRKTTL